MKLIQMLRRLPLWAATCVGMLILTFVLVLARGLFGPPAPPLAPRQAVATVAPSPVQSAPTPTASAQAASLHVHEPEESAPLATATPAIAASVLAGIASADLRAPVSALQAPEGVKEGHVVRVSQARDQYRQWVTMSTATVPMPDASFYAPKEQQGYAQRVIWHGWFRLEAQATVAVLHVKADTGTVSAEIDGQPIGEIEHSGNRPPDRQVSSIALSQGWHQMTVTQQGAAIAQIAVTDGRSAPVIIVPWAVTDESLAEAQAATTAPAPASTTKALSPASAASAAPGVAIETAL